MKACKCLSSQIIWGSTADCNTAQKMKFSINEFFRNGCYYKR